MWHIFRNDPDIRKKAIQGEPDVIGKFLEALGLVCTDQVAAEDQARVKQSLEESGPIRRFPVRL
jgi:hypothetical protein